MSEFVSSVYSVSQKIPLGTCGNFFKNGWEFFNQILRAYYAFLSTLDYIFIQLSATLSDEVMQY